MKSTAKLQAIKFFKIFIPFCIVLALVDYVVGYVFEYNYDRQKQGVLFMVSYAINKTDADYFVVGSSRANHHYDSKLIQNITGHTFFNSGSEGRGVIYSCAVASASIHRYKPKLVIIDIRPNEFTVTDDGDLTALLPYYKNPYVRSYLNYDRDFQEVKLLSKIYPYNSLATTIIAGRLDEGKNTTLDHGGYIPLSGSIQQATEVPSFKENKSTVDSAKVKMFKQLLTDLERQKIKSLVVMSPLYFNYTNGATIDICKNLVAEMKYSSFISFANRSVFFDKNKFQDNMHLNKYGASHFSKQIAEKIKSYMANSNL
jgi:hypothetical protein